MIDLKAVVVIIQRSVGVVIVVVIVVAVIVAVVVAVV